MARTTTAISNNEDIIDIRDVIDRIDYLEGLEHEIDEGEQEELDTLKALAEECKGNGGDEHTLVRDSYFEEYAEELAVDIGAVGTHDTQWPLMYIDWEAAANALKMDYTSVEFDGVEYWTR